jgi:hypothetical protein
MRWEQNVARIGRLGYAYKMSGRKPERERQFEKSRHGREDNIKTDLREIVCEVLAGFFWLKIVFIGGSL